MDPIPRHGINENDPLSANDLNRIQNLSLKDHNQKLNLEAGEFKDRFKDSFWTNFGGDGTCASCLCGGPMNHPDRSDNVWTFPKQKLYSAAEDPTRKKYSPLVAPSPRKYTLYTPAMCKELAHLSQYAIISGSTEVNDKERFRGRDS